MNRLLRTEWLKLKAYRPFWVLFVLYPVCLTGVVAVSLWGQSKMQDLANSAGAGKAIASHLPFAFPTAWQSVAYAAGWLHFIPAMLLILAVTNEFSFRTHRQNLLEGWSRAQFLAAKGLLALVLCLYCTAVTLVATIVAGAVSKSTPTFQGVEYLALFLMQSLVYAAFALLSAFLIRRAALAVAAFLLYSVILENVVAFFINLKFPGLGHYLPLEAAGGLVPVPFLKERAGQVVPELMGEPGQGIMIGLAAGYLVVFSALLWGRFRREDL